MSKKTNSTRNRHTGRINAFKAHVRELAQKQHSKKTPALYETSDGTVYSRAWMGNSLGRCIVRGASW